jgi:hypothetical protein
MASYTWAVDANGDWNNSSNWGTSTLPTQNDNVSIGGGGIAGITVTISAGAATAYTLSVVQCTLSITGGSLYTVDMATFGGGYTQSGGIYIAGGRGANFNGAFNMTGGTIAVQTGVVSLNGTNSMLAGTFTGIGTLNIGGSAYINTGFAATIANFSVSSNGSLGLNTNFAYNHNFTSQGVLDLFGHTLTLGGTALFGGTIGFGTIVDSGTLVLGAPRSTAMLNNGLTLKVSGLAEQAGGVYLGDNDAGCRLQITKNGEYAINGNWNIGDLSQIGSITNLGIFAKTFGGGASTIADSLVSNGTIDVQAGELQLDGRVNSLSGTVSGNGTLALGAGQTTIGKLTLGSAAFAEQGGVLILNTALSYGGIWDMTGGTLDLAKEAAVLTLSNRADFEGGTLSGYGGSLVIGAGAVAEMNNFRIGGPQTLTINGLVDQTGNVSFGASSNPVATITAGATWLISNDSTLSGTFGNFINRGTISDTAGAGVANFQPNLVSTGTINVGNSTLSLTGSDTLSGTLSGGGLLDLGGIITLNGGISASIAGIELDNGALHLNGNFVYANDFGENGGYIDLQGQHFTSTAAGRLILDSGALIDGGTLTAAGHAVIGNYTIGEGTTLLISGTAEQTGTLYLTDNGTGALTIAVGGFYTLDDDVSIDPNGGGGFLTIAGTFATGGNGNSSIGSTISETGLLAVNDQLLLLGAGGSIAGQVTGTGELLFASGTFALQHGANMASAIWGIGNSTVDLNSNLSYAGTFLQTGGTLALGANTLTLAGTSIITGGILTGAGSTTQGSLVLSGAGTLANLQIAADAIFDITGTAEENGSNSQTGSVTLLIGDTNNNQAPPSGAEILVATGGLLTIDTNSTITGNGSLNVAGTLATIGGTNVIYTSIAETGLIQTNGQTLALANGGTLAGKVTGTGQFDLASGTFALNAGFAISAASWLIAGSVVQLNEKLSYGGALLLSGGHLELGANTLAASGSAMLATGVVSGAGISSTGGTLLLSGTSQLGSITVNNGAVLDVAGTGLQIAGTTIQVGEGSPLQTPLSTADLTIAAKSSLTLGAGDVITGNGTLTVTGTLAASSSSSGNSAVFTTIVDAGTIAANLGTLTLYNAINGSGSFSIGNGGNLVFGGEYSTVGATNIVNFAGPNAALSITDTGHFAAQLASFAAGDVIDLLNWDPGTITGSLTAGGTVLTVHDGTGHSAMFTFTAAQNAAQLSFGADAAHGGVAAIFHH